MDKEIVESFLETNEIMQMMLIRISELADRVVDIESQLAETNQAIAEIEAATATQ